MKNNLIILVIVAVWWSFGANAQNRILKGEHVQLEMGEDFTVRHLIFSNHLAIDTIPFFHKGKNRGPSLYTVTEKGQEIAKWSATEKNNLFKTKLGRLDATLEYRFIDGYAVLNLTITNKGHVAFQPQKLGLKMGLDTYMDHYPEWMDKYFPTYVFNEKTHTYGYFQSPTGNRLAIVSLDPVASWSVDYNLGYQDPKPHWFMGHRIESFNLDLMNELPLPEHSPQDLWTLAPGEQKNWRLLLIPVYCRENFAAKLHHIAKIPMLDIPQTSCRAREKLTFNVYADYLYVLSLADESGNHIKYQLNKVLGGLWRVQFFPPKEGIYSIRLRSGKYQTTGKILVHSEWNKVIREARKAALRYHQKASSHVESWYGCYSSFIAARYFPDKELDEKMKERFEFLLNTLYNKDMSPKYYESRIQNTAATISMLVDMYEADREVKNLEKAAMMADWLIDKWQRKDGAYVNHNRVYTSVIYVAKNILELAIAERKLSQEDKKWEESAKRHYNSAKKAIDQLVEAQGNFETEGEMTFEDGMISCSALQIGMLALMQTNQKEREHYTAAMLAILNSHDCLTQLFVPDGRRRGGTMRYWEAQYDVLMLPNMFNSPHGWSAWRAYATYYAYLLTGDEKWLIQTYNAVAAFSNLIDTNTGKLSWAFVVDPYLKVRQVCEADQRYNFNSLTFGNPHPDLYPTKEFVIGEQYVNMVSDWQPVNTQDNDVHEVFKCLEETMLTQAFVVEHEDGTLKGYNCKIEQRGDSLFVEPSENQITKLHCNLKTARIVLFKGLQKKISSHYRGWVFGEDAYLFNLN